MKSIEVDLKAANSKHPSRHQAVPLMIRSSSYPVMSGFHSPSPTFRASTL